MQSIRRAQDLLSQQLGKGATLEDVSEAALEFYLSKKDPLRVPVKTRKCKPAPAKAAHPKQRQALKVSIRRRVHHQNESQCSHIDEQGQRCQQRRHLHIHHIKPVWEGGTNEIGNLTILCSGHHAAHHRSTDN